MCPGLSTAPSFKRKIENLKYWSKFLEQLQYADEKLQLKYSFVVTQLIALRSRN